jgi:hypothetical protein
LQNAPFCPISASDSNFNPLNTQCIPVVKTFVFLEHEQNRTFFKGLSIAMVIGYLKGKSAVRIHWEALKTKGTLFGGRTFWARGYGVSTIALDEHQIRQYVREQKKLQKDQEQTEFDFE